MMRYAGRRAAAAAVTLWLLTILAFSLVHLTGDGALVAAPPHAGPEEIERIRARLGLDQPLPVQYVRFMGNLLRGELSLAYQGAHGLWELVVPRAASTLQLALTVMILIAVTAVPLGTLAALHRGKPVDVGLRILTALAQAAPAFFLAVLLVMALSRWLPAWPIIGQQSWASVLPPALAIALGPAAEVARHARNAAIEVMDQEFIQFARAKGLTPAAVIVKHGLRNALIPVVTILALRSAKLMSGSIVVEAVFARPGLGTLTLEAIRAHNIPLVQACLLTTGALVIAVSLALDLCCLWIDPRIKYETGAL